MRTIAVFCLASLALIVFATFSSGAPTPQRAVLTIRVAEFHTIDIGHPGANIGDRYMRRLRILDRHGRIVGSGYDDCRWVTELLAMCQSVYDLPSGDVVMSGVVGDGEPLAITGGTDGYTGAQGEMRRVGRSAVLTFTGE